MKVYDYLRSIGKGEGATERGDHILCCCPLHPEDHPSFQIYGHDDHWCCFHEQQTGDLAKLVNIFEFGGVDTREGWKAVYQRVRELTGTPQTHMFAPRIVRPELPYATFEQRALLTAAMHWWYAQLWTPDLGNRGRAYFRHRGVSLPDLRFCVQLGYAPANWSEHDYRSFAEAMTYAVGNGWEPMARNLGLLSKEQNSLRLRDRVMFCSTNELGECLFFQSRQVQFTDDRPKYPYLNAQGVRKVPFFIAVPQATSSLTHIESPFGTAILAPYAMEVMASHGGPSEAMLSEPWLRARMRNRLQIICMDNDAPHRTHTGEVYYPGDHHAQVLQSFFEREHFSAIRVIPPALTKGPDEWIRAEGIEPFLDQIRSALARVPQIDYTEYSTYLVHV